MASKSKKSRASGRFGARYGKKIRDKLVQVEDKQRKKQICPFCKKIGLKRLSKDYVQNTLIPFPPMIVQKSIVKKLDSLSAETKKLEGIYQQKLNDLEELKKAILQKAFNGELTKD